ncbi:MAG: ROK family protein [Verrucomicrobiota bacterium]|nr:ROK family protein [Verrucomicrobiota bacterium]
MDDKKYILGYDIGGTKIAISIADSLGKILDSDRIKTGEDSIPEQVMEDVKKITAKILQKVGLSLEDVRAAGIASPGPIDVPNGIMLPSPNMPNWKNVPIKKWLEEFLGVDVFFDNDANAGVLVEWFFGAGRGKKDVLYLTMSTGIGGGIISNGVLIQGHTGQAGEVGHNIIDINGPECGCGMKGCFEAFCGGNAVSKRLRKIVENNPNHPFLAIEGVDGNPENLSYPEIRKAAENGLPEAIRFWDETCMRLAQGIGICMMTLNPEVIILGTLALYSGDTLMVPLKKYIKRFAWPEMYENCEITKSELGKHIGELAGIAVALYGLRDR